MKGINSAVEYGDVNGILSYLYNNWQLFGLSRRSIVFFCILLTLSTLCRLFLSICVCTFFLRYFNEVLVIFFLNDAYSMLFYRKYLFISLNSKLISFMKYLLLQAPTSQSFFLQFWLDRPESRHGKDILAGLRRKLLGRGAPGEPTHSWVIQYFQVLCPLQRAKRQEFAVPVMGFTSLHEY